MPTTRSQDNHNSDQIRLFELLKTVNQLVTDMPFVRDGKRDLELDQISALLGIAEDMAERLADEVENGFPTPGEAS